MEIVGECKELCLCSECTKESCARHGDIEQDCPKWKCDVEHGDCSRCAFLKRYQKDMREYYKQKTKRR